MRFVDLSKKLGITCGEISDGISEQHGTSDVFSPPSTLLAVIIPKIRENTGEITCFRYIFLLLLLLELVASSPVYGIDITFSSCNPNCNYTITVENGVWSNSNSLFLFTFSPLEHDVPSVLVVDSDATEVTVPLSKKYGLYSLALAGYTFPLSINFSIPPPLATEGGTTGSNVGFICSENLDTMTATCQFIPTTYVAPLGYHVSVLHSDSMSALRFALPYPALNYKVRILKNAIFTVNETASVCEPDPSSFTTDLECLLNLSTSTSDPLLPYEAQIPLQMYSYSRASLAPTLPIISISYLVQDSVSTQTLLTYIAQFASITMDPLDSSRFSITGPSSDPSTTPAPVTEAVIANTVVLRPAAVDWRLNTPPAQPVGVGILLHSEAAHIIDPSLLRVDQEGVMTRTHVSRAATADAAASAKWTGGRTIPSLLSRARLRANSPITSALVSGSTLGLWLAAFEQGYRANDMLLLALDVSLLASDVFISDAAECIVTLPRNVTCVVKTDIPRDADGTSAVLIHSTAFALIESLQVAVTHMAPGADMSGTITAATLLTPLAINVTRLLTKFRAFSEIGVGSHPWPPWYDMLSDQFLNSPYSDASIHMMHTDVPYVLTNQRILVEVGCLLEKSQVSVNSEPCTRVCHRMFSCPFPHGVIDALSEHAHAVTIDGLTWHESIAHRSSPVVLKRVLASNHSVVFEQVKRNVHVPQEFRFDFNNLSLTIMRENTTLTANLHGKQAPRLFYPSVDRLVLNVTEPLFTHAAGETLNITGLFTPLVQVVLSATHRVASDPVGSWQLDPAAAVPLECYPVSAFAVACMLTRETVVQCGRVSVSIAHDQPRVTPYKVSVSASIYADTDISACGGYNPLQASLLALSAEVSSSIERRLTNTRVSGPFVTANADIAAAQRGMRTLSNKWRAYSNHVSSDHGESVAVNVVAAGTEGVLPADWSLAFMATIADVPVTDLWSTSASTSTSWALSPAVLWLWPTLGAVLLFLAGYRVYKWRRQMAPKVHPHSAASTLNAADKIDLLDIHTAASSTSQRAPAPHIQPWDSDPALATYPRASQYTAREVTMTNEPLPITATSVDGRVDDRITIPAEPARQPEYTGRFFKCMMGFPKLGDVYECSPHIVATIRDLGSTDQALSSVSKPYHSSSPCDTVPTSYYLARPSPNWAAVFAHSPSPQLASLSPEASLGLQHQMCRFSPYPLTHENTMVSTDEQGLICFNTPQISRSCSSELVDIPRIVSPFSGYRSPIAAAMMVAHPWDTVDSPVDDFPVDSSNSASDEHTNDLCSADETNHARALHIPVAPPSRFILEPIKSYSHERALQPRPMGNGSTARVIAALDSTISHLTVQDGPVPSDSTRACEVRIPPPSHTSTMSHVTSDCDDGAYNT